MRLTILFALTTVLWGQTHPAVTKATVDRWMKELSNWNRWGADDKMGAVNLITPAKRKQAAALVTDGVSVSLSHDALKEKAVDNPLPFKHDMLITGQNNPGMYTADNYSVSYHGYAISHMDALCHMFYQGKMFNGHSQETITKAGAGKLGILGWKNGIFTKAVLMDMAALKVVKWLEPGTPIYPDDLEVWEKKAGVKVEAGDVILIRTGRWGLRAAKGPFSAGDRSAGLHASCAPWLRKRDVSIVGSDAASDVMPSGVPGVAQPIHQLVLISMGIPIFDNMDLEAVSMECATRKRWSFLVTAAPLAIPGGTGSPMNPIATF